MHQGLVPIEHIEGSFQSDDNALDQRILFLPGLDSSVDPRDRLRAAIAPTLAQGAELCRSVSMIQSHGDRAGLDMHAARPSWNS